jgi:hypothetical protein
MCASTFSTAFMSMSGPITAPGSKPYATFIAPAVSVVSRFAILRGMCGPLLIFSECEAAHT